MGTNVYGCVKQLFLLKKRNRALKVLLSIGGWTYSGNFAQPASTAGGRQTFASSAVRLVEDLGLDGLDIDWEYPKDAAEADNFVHLLRETRQALEHASRKHQHRRRRDFLLTIACPAGPSNFSKLKIREMDPYLDFWNLMAYDNAGSWDAHAGHQSNLYPSRAQPRATPFSTAVAIDHYTRHGGVHPSKLVLGMPLYGRAFGATDGPGHPVSGTGSGGSWEPGIWDYKALPRPGATEHHDCGDGDDACGASWSYDPDAKVMVTYDTVAMAEFVRDRGLGGGMWWESSGDGDVGGGKKSLVHTFVRASGGKDRLEARENCLDYPESKFENLRNGFPGE